MERKYKLVAPLSTKSLRWYYSYLITCCDNWARGGVDVLYLSQIVNNGDLKSEGDGDGLLTLQQLTTIFRPQEMQVGEMIFRRENQIVFYPGNRSGAEASSPTGDAGCLGIAGLRRSWNFHRW